METMNITSLLLFFIFLSIIAFLLFFPSADFTITKQKEKINCTEESRNVTSCPTSSQQVCGFSSSQQQTFTNSCFACKNSQVLYWIEGGCSS